MFDQPLDVMRQMDVALNTFDAFTARERAENAVKFSENHPELVEYCQWVERLRDG